MVRILFVGSFIMSCKCQTKLSLHKKIKPEAFDICDNFRLFRRQKKGESTKSILIILHPGTECDVILSRVNVCWGEINENIFNKNDDNDKRKIERTTTKKQRKKDARNITPPLEMGTSVSAKRNLFGFMKNEFCSCNDFSFANVVLLFEYRAKNPILSCALLTTHRSACATSLCLSLCCSLSFWHKTDSQFRIHMINSRTVDTIFWIFMRLP